MIVLMSLTMPRCVLQIGKEAMHSSDDSSQDLRCLCLSGTKTWKNQKAFKNHCSKSDCRSSSFHNATDLDARDNSRQVLHEKAIGDTRDYVSTITDSLADSMALMRFKHNMTHPLVDASVRQAHAIQVVSLDCVAAILKDVISPSQAAYMDSVFDILKKCTSSDHYGTAKKRTKLVMKRYKPTPVSMHRSYRNEDHEMVYIADIAIDEALERLLQNHETCEAAFRPHTHQQGLYTDIRDGYLFRTHPIFKNGSLTSFALMLYAGDFELLNPIGQRKGYHKVTVFYWQLVNLHPSVRVLQVNIQLACVVLAKTLSDKHMPFVVGGNIDDPLCKSIGGSLRRLHKGA
jgi:hypothetical protein